MSDERLEQIKERTWDALWGLEVKGDTGWAEVVVRSDMPDLMAEVKRLGEALRITDEMVERGAEALHLANSKDPTTGPQWDAICADWPEIAALYRRGVRAALKAALGVEE